MSSSAPASRLSVRDITDPISAAAEAIKACKNTNVAVDVPTAVTLEDAGFSASRPRTHTPCSDASLQSARDGQTLGYDWTDIVANWHERAFTSFGDGHGVWESSSGLVLPFYTRNLVGVTQWAQPIGRADLMQTIANIDGRFNQVPPGEGLQRTLRTKTDAIESAGIDLSRVMGPSGKGIVWAGVREGSPIANSRRLTRETDKSTIVQVTNLGVNVKYSPQTRSRSSLASIPGEPVQGANISLIRRDGAVAWQSTTGSDGAAIGGAAPRLTRNGTTRRSISSSSRRRMRSRLSAIRGTRASPVGFRTYPDPREIDPLLRGSVFTDRGVYRLAKRFTSRILRSIRQQASGCCPRALPAKWPYTTVRTERSTNAPSRSAMEQCGMDAAFAADGALAPIASRRHGSIRNRPAMTRWCRPSVERFSSPLTGGPIFVSMPR